MTTEEIQNMIKNILQRLIASDEIDDVDDDVEMADVARDLMDEVEGIKSVVGFDDVMMLTRDDGIVIRTRGGDEFQITIVQSKFGQD